MLSLKYKNLVKKTLMEELSEDDIIKDEQVLNTFLTDIKYFPFFSFENEALINEDKDSLNIYVLTSVSDAHRYSGKKLNDDEIDIYDYDFNKNKDYLYEYYSFSVFSLENHLGVLSYNRKRVKYRLLYNYNQEKNLYDIDSFKKLFKKRLKKNEIKDFVEKYVSKIIEELNNNYIKTNSTKSHLNKKEIFKLSNDPNIKIWDIKDYTTTEKTNSEYDSEKNKDNPNFMYTKRHKILRLTPTRLIGDDDYRNITNLKLKVQNTLKDFMSKTKNPEELLASEILFQEIESISNGNGDKDIQLNEFNINTEGINLHNSLLYLTKDPNEVISPIAVLKMDNITWSQDSNGQSAKDEIQKIFGNKTAFNNGVISFPLTSNEPLVDSYAMITYNGKSRQLGVSTKGGLNGKGANASLSSLFRFLLDDDTKYIMNKWGYNKEFSDKVEKVCKNNGDIVNLIEIEIGPYLSNVGRAFWNESTKTRDLLVLLILFGGTPLKKHQNIINYAVSHGIGDLRFKNKDVTAFAAEASSEGLTKLVMEILDKHKYKFCQVNTTPSLTENSFKYEIKVQYPAKFSGTVTFAPADYGLRFHISGD